MSFASTEYGSVLIPPTNLAEYEAWASLDWLHPHGSEEAQRHAREKFREEASELGEALRTGDPDDIVSELGDVLWTSTANVLNAGIGLEDSLRREQPADFEAGPITFGQIDIAALRLIPDESIESMVSWTDWMSHYVGKASMQWLHLKELVDETKPPSATNDGQILLKRMRATDGIAQTIFLCSAIAQRHAGKSIADVISGNVEKLEGRKAAGLPVTRLPRVIKNTK